MANIEPYQYQKVTNIKEHNDIVAKINEIVDVINNTNMETIIPRISKLEQDITTINATDSLQWTDIESVKTDINTINPKITKLEQDVTDINSTDAIQNTNISNLKTKDSEHDTRLGTIDTEIAGITKSLVSDVAILNGTTSGNVKVRIGLQDAPSINSDDYNIQKPTSVELIQGSAPAMVKAQITLSDGTVLVSDDFMFTTEAIGTDVYISSFVFKNGNVAGSISADIGLSNGSTLTANNFVVPTDPNVTTAISDLQGKVTTVENDVSGLKTTVNGHTTSINGLDSEVSDLQTRMTAVEGGSVAGFEELEAQVNTNKTNIATLTTEIDDLDIKKADQSNTNQEIVAGTITATNITKGGVNVATTNDIPDISGKVDKAQGISNAGKVLGINASGNVEPVTIESGGEVWEEVDLTNWATDWVVGDKIKLTTKLRCNSSGQLSNTDRNWSPIMEFYLGEVQSTASIYHISNYEFYSCTITALSSFNNSYNRISIFTLNYRNINSGTSNYVDVTRDILPNYVDYIKMWRLKK